MVFGRKNLYKSGRYESYRLREKEYDIPEPPDEEEDPQLIETGPRYSSDDAGDCPFCEIIRKSSLILRVVKMKRNVNDIRSFRSSQILY